MKDLTLENIARAVSGQLVYPENKEKEYDKKEITCAVTDNRKIEQGGLFIPIRGARVDGHSFIPAAYKAGALCCFSEEDPDPAIEALGPVIYVKSTEQALKDLAAYYRSVLSIPFIGIIGSVGKTSTKEMVASVLSQKYRVLKTQGNFNNEIGLPLTILSIREEHEVAVTEMGISDFGEMKRLGAIASPDMVVMTNIGECHLENLKDRDGVLKAKTEVFPYMKTGGHVFLNGDDDKLSTVKSVPGETVHYYGLERLPEGPKCEVKAEDISEGSLSGQTFTMKTEAGDIKISLPLPGIHHVYNALAAASVGLAMGLGAEEIKAGVESIETISGRNNIIERDDITIIDDCYNANPQSMAASLSVLSRAAGRKIAVLGDMGELGADEVSLHRKVGAEVAKNRIDILFTSGELSKAMEEEALVASSKEGYALMALHFDDKDALIEELKKTVKKGDTLLIKASHFMEYHVIVEALCSQE